MKVIVTGATGMVGKGVLLECLEDSAVTEVVSISRRTLGLEHAKLKEILHSDFSNFEAIKDQLSEFDAAFLCMGVSAAGMDEAEYSKLTYDFTMSLANTLYEMSPNLTLTYTSGQGTDSTEKGKTMWARVKGKLENDLLALGFKGAYMFRPGVIIPLRGIRSGTKLYQFFYDYLLWLIKLMKLVFPNSIVNTTQLGISMIQVAKEGYAQNILDPIDILISANHA
jgi:uncharacterized protein YbjT (DUF2867 family)